MTMVFPNESYHPHPYSSLKEPYLPFLSLVDATCKHFT